LATAVGDRLELHGDPAPGHSANRAIQYVYAFRLSTEQGIVGRAAGWLPLSCVQQECAPQAPAPEGDRRGQERAPQAATEAARRARSQEDSHNTKEKAEESRRRIASAPDAWHRVLGVQQWASVVDVKRAYKELAILHHPDKAHGSSETFQRVKEAYEQGLRLCTGAR